MTDKDLIAFAKFILFRFNGIIPSDILLEYAAKDWRKDNE